jgi:DNA-binding Xre family transcriptional regulator
MGQHSDKIGRRVTYDAIREATRISSNTLSHIATNKQQMVSLDVLERLCDFFGCELQELMRLEPPAEES